MTDISDPIARMKYKNKRKEELEAGNDRAYQELQQAVGGKFEMNTADARRELFVDMLIEWGVITEEQKLDFDIRFHEKIEEALTEFWRQFREQQAASKLHLPNKGMKLVDGQGRPLN